MSRSEGHPGKAAMVNERPIFLFLSSGASARYRDDVLRALAMPAGMELQFRYRLDELVADSVRQLIESGDAIGIDGLLCYLDRSDKSKDPEVVPCRYAKVKSIQCAGGSMIVHLDLSDFPVTADLVEFNKSIRATQTSDRTGMLPSWVQTVDGSEPFLSGQFWIERPAFPDGVRPEKDHSKELVVFEAIADELAQRADFGDESAYFHLLGIFDSSSDKIAPVKDGVVKLGASGKYEVRFYHYSPEGPRARARLRLSSNVDRVAFTSTPILELDSRYDLKIIRMKVMRQWARQHGVLTVSRPMPPSMAPADMGEETVFFDVPVEIKGSLFGTVLMALLLGTLLFASSAVPILSKDDFQMTRDGWLLATQLALSLVIGIMASFGLRRPI